MNLQKIYSFSSLLNEFFLQTSLPERQNLTFLVFDRRFERVRVLVADFRIIALGLAAVFGIKALLLLNHTKVTLFMMLNEPKTTMK